MTTIRDVATRAGVSTATVSHALAKTRGVSSVLRKKVIRAARELNYRPNEIARSLRTRNSKTIGMIIPSITDPFFPMVVRGAEDVLQKEGYTLLIGNSDDDPKKEEAYYRAFSAKRVDGVLMIISPAKRAPSFLLHHRAAQTPIVYIGRFHHDLQGDYVMLDDIGSSREAVTHLLRTGRRRIGIVTGPLDLLDARMRLEGYKLAHEDYGVAIDPTLIREGQYTIESGYEQAKALIQLTSMPEALFSSNHLMTIGCLRAILEAGINCPQQISLASFDDTGWFDLFRPSITAIRQPAYDLGTTGAEFLLKRVQAKVSGPPRHVLLRGQMNVRASSTPPSIESGKVNTAQTDISESEKLDLTTIQT